MRRNRKRSKMKGRTNAGKSVKVSVSETGGTGRTKRRRSNSALR